MLAEQLAADYRLAHLSFAAPIRQFVAKLLGISWRELEETKEQPIDWLDGVTPRHMMQTLGTEWGRQMVHNDLWTRVIMHSLPSEGAIISDVRFVNEAELIRKHGGVVIKIERPGTGHGDGHVSETPLPDSLISATLVNNGSPQDLFGKAAYIISRLERHG